MPNIAESLVLVNDMSCAACAATIEGALGKVNGVLSASVSIANKQTLVKWDSQIVTPNTWLQAIIDAGYSPVLLTQDGSERTKPEDFPESRRKAHRRLVWQWGVAAICMMQVMMYATPSYWASPQESDANLWQLMRYASLALSLPVLLFSCQPFFSKAWLDLKHRRISMDLPVALGMALSFAVSAWITLFPHDPTIQASSLMSSEVYFDSFTMFVFFLLSGRWIESNLKNKTLDALDGLLTHLPQQIERLVSNRAIDQSTADDWQIVSTSSLKIGDTVRTRMGEAFAADGKVLKGNSWVEEAMLSGESKPIAKNVGDSVLCGSHNLGETLLIQVTALGEETRHGQIAQIMRHAAFAKPRMAILADRIAKPFLVAILILALAAAAFWWHLGAAHAIMVAVSLLVVTCPCALSLATPVAMLASTAKLARNGILIRQTPILERAADVCAVFFDKTGTLTRDAFVLTRIKTRTGETESAALAQAAQIAQHSLHPLSRSLCTAARMQGSVVQVEQITYVQALTGQGLDSTGALGGHYRLGSASFCNSEPFVTNGAQVHLSGSQGWLASFEFEEQIRTDAQATLVWLRNHNIQTWLVSGDTPNAVSHVAHALQFDNRLVRSSCTPEQKLALLTKIKNNQATDASTPTNQNGAVAMVGDGLNDGPVLAAADVSLTFGHASSLTQQHSDVIILGERVSAIALLIDQSKRTMTIVKQNLLWAFLYNLTCVPLALLGYLPAWAASIGMAASSILVILNAMRLLRPSTIATLE